MRVATKAVAMILYVFSAILYHVQAQSSSEGKINFILTGTVEDLAKGTVILTYADSSAKGIQIKAELENNAFIIQGVLLSPVLANLKIAGVGTDKSYDTSYNVYLDPGNMTVIIHNKTDRALEEKGSVTQNDWQSLEKLKSKELKNERSSVTCLRELYHKINAGDTARGSKAAMQAVQERVDSLVGVIFRIDLAFVRHHPTSFINPYLLHVYNGKVPIDTLAELYQRLSPMVQQSIEGKNIGRSIQAGLSVAIGKPAPEFSFSDSAGNLISLSSFKGKDMVLLDFWASWCVPCRSVTPYIKQLYAKYQAKGLKLIGITLDFDQQVWRKFLKEDSVTNWYNIFGDLRHAGEPDNLITKYNVSGIPDIFVIDKQGMIVGRFTSTENIVKMERLLKEYLQ